MKFNMKTVTRFLRRHSLIGGIVLMFLLTWPIDLANAQILPFRVPFAMYILVGYGFIIAALVMTRVTLGQNAVVSLLKRFLIWRVRWTWYLVALFLLPIIYTLAVFLNSLLNNSLPDFSSVFAYNIFGPSANLPLLILPFFLFDAITNGEEMGWRGYVLPRLQENYSLLISSLILAVVWWFWHLPKFLAPENGASFGLYFFETLPKAILYTWIYHHTRGSLLLVTLFHASGNTAGVFFPVANTVSESNVIGLVLVIGILFLIATGVVLSDIPAWLSRKHHASLKELFYKLNR